MKSTKNVFFRNTFLYFISILLLFALGSIYIKHNLYTYDCHANLKHILPGNFNFERVSIALWLKICDQENIFFGSSEATGENSIPDLIRSQGYQFSQFTGAHRGIKTYGFFSSLDIASSLTKNSHFLILLNPIYFTEGPAKTAPTMGYRTAVTNAYFNEVVGVKVAQQKPIIDRPWVAVKNTFDELVFLIKNRPLIPQPINEEQLLNDTIARFKKENNYNLKLNLLKNNENAHFASEIQFNISPTKQLFMRVAENKNQLKQCVVLLPMNKRFFKNQNIKYETQINQLYQEIRKNLKKSELIDLSFLDNTDYVFIDIMHFTTVGSILVAKQIRDSSCFKGLW